jgi:predicted ferric reductase
MMIARLATDSKHAARIAPRPRRLNARTLPASICAAAIVINALIIAWLWATGNTFSGVHSWGDLWTSVGRLTGLLSAYLALVQVLLLARLPWLERMLGFDRLTIWHRVNGKLCLYLVLAHVVFITIGYALTDQIAAPAEFLRLLTDYPGMIAATVGTVLMVAVVAMSLVIARRHFRYEAWYAVHLTVYAGIALAWFHQIPTGNELTANATAADYWTGLYLATLVLLLWFRLLVPIVQAWRFRLRVESVRVEGPGVVSLRIGGRNLHRLNARAGQFFLWRFLGRGRWWESHPFSLSAAPDGRSLRITIKASGDFTRRIGQITPGTRVMAEGPFGVFTSAARCRERVLFIAGGIGITPVRAMAEEMSGDISIVYRVGSADDLIFRAELERLARDRGIALHFAVGDHTRSETKDYLSIAHLRRLVPDLLERDIYVCGPPAMLRIVERDLASAGVRRQQLHTERFAL